MLLKSRYPTLVRRRPVQIISVGLELKLHYFHLSLICRTTYHNLRQIEASAV